MCEVWYKYRSASVVHYTHARLAIIPTIIFSFHAKYRSDIYTHTSLVTAISNEPVFHNVEISMMLETYSFVADFSWADGDLTELALIPVSTPCWWELTITGSYTVAAAAAAAVDHLILTYHSTTSVFWPVA